MNYKYGPLFSASPVNLFLEKPSQTGPVATHLRIQIGIIPGCIAAVLKFYNHQSCDVSVILFHDTIKLMIWDRYSCNPPQNVKLK